MVISASTAASSVRATARQAPVRSLNAHAAAADLSEGDQHLAVAAGDVEMAGTRRDEVADPGRKKASLRHQVVAAPKAVSLIPTPEQLPDHQRTMWRWVSISAGRSSLWLHRKAGDTAW